MGGVVSGVTKAVGGVVGDLLGGITSALAPEQQPAPLPPPPEPPAPPPTPAPAASVTDAAPLSRQFTDTPSIPAPAPAPKVEVTPPPAAPTVEDTKAVTGPVPTTTDPSTAATEAVDAKRRRRGRAATVLTGPLGAGAPTGVATKALLGD